LKIYSRRTPHNSIYSQSSFDTIIHPICHSKTKLRVILTKLIRKYVTPTPSFPSHRITTAKPLGSAYIWTPVTDRFVQLSKYPTLNNLEKQSSVPKVYAFLGLISTYFFLIFFNIGGQFLTNIAGFVIPGYYSLEALFSSGKSDDTQWLTVCRVLNTIKVFANNHT